VRGKEVVISDGAPIFGGVMQEFEQQKPVFAAPVLYYDVRIAGYESRLDRLYVNAVAFGRGPFESNAISDVLTFADGFNPYQNDNIVAVRSTNTPPAPLTTSGKYYVINRTSTTCQLSMSSGGSPINLTNDGIGRHHLIKYAGSIVRGLITQGFTAGIIRDGTAVELLTAEWSTYADIIEELARLSGYVWYVGANKQLHFIPRTEYAAPFNVTDASAQILSRNLRFRHTDEVYANRVYLRLNSDAFAKTVVSRNGDGTNKIFYFSTVINQVVSITVNGIEKTVGILDVDTGKDWYYTPGDHYIYQDDAASPLGSSDTLFVSYRAYGFDSVSDENTSEQTARSALEPGTNGRYEVVLQNTAITNQTQGQSMVTAILNERIGAPIECLYETRVAGLQPGQLQTINLPAFGVNATFLTDKVDASIDEDQKIRYKISALSTTQLPDYLSLFTSFLAGGGGAAGIAAGGAAIGPSDVTIRVPQTLTASSTSITEPIATGILVVTLIQDATGGRGITWGSAFHSSTPTILQPDPNARNHFLFFSDGTHWRLLSSIEVV
jgi:hypothetical protein